MSNWLPRLLGVAILYVFSSMCARAGEDMLSLEEYTKISQVLEQEDVLPRLFYSGLGEAKLFEVQIKATEAFPAVSHSPADRQTSFVLNSVSVAIMDRMAEADYIATSISDPTSLERYLQVVTEIINKFNDVAPVDWRLLIDRVPTFSQFYKSAGLGPSSWDSGRYSLVRRVILTNELGAVTVREFTEVGLALEGRAAYGPNYLETLNQRAAEGISRAKFDAAPVTALVIYAVLKNANAALPRFTLDHIICNEASFQRMLRSNAEQFESRPSAGNLILNRAKRC